MKTITISLLSVLLIISFECSGQDSTFLKGSLLKTDSSFFFTPIDSNYRSSYFTLGSKPIKYCPITMSKTPRIDYMICKYSGGSDKFYLIIANSDKEEDRWSIEYLNGKLVLHRYKMKDKEVSRGYAEKIFTKYSTIWGW